MAPYSSLPVAAYIFMAYIVMATRPCLSLHPSLCLSLPPMPTTHADIPNSYIHICPRSSPAHHNYVGHNYISPGLPPSRCLRCWQGGWQPAARVSGSSCGQARPVTSRRLPSVRRAHTPRPSLRLRRPAPTRCTCVQRQVRRWIVETDAERTGRETKTIFRIFFCGTGLLTSR